MLQKFAGQDEVLASDIETLIKASPRQDGDYVRVGKLREPLKSILLNIARYQTYNELSFLSLYSFSGWWTGTETES